MSVTGILTWLLMQMHQSANTDVCEEKKASRTLCVFCEAFNPRIRSSTEGLKSICQSGAHVVG